MPIPILTLIDSMAILLSQAAMLTRTRLASHPSPVVRTNNLRNQDFADNQLMRRELAVLHDRLAMLKPQHRPDCTPPQRWEITQIMRLRGWTIDQAAEHFVLHPNTLRSWLRAVQQEGENHRLFIGLPGWNRLHNGVRYAAQMLRTLFAEPEFGTRTMACLKRNAVQISRSSVQRILREPPTPAPAPKPTLIPPAGKNSFHLLKPKTPNRVWHVDLTTLQVLWLRFAIVAVIDGFSRKILAMRPYAKVPGTGNVLALIRAVITQFGRPRFLVTDHGGQFKKRFATGLERLGVTHVLGRVHCPAMNGKIERFFRTFRGWVRGTVVGLAAPLIQRRLDRFCHWYNHYRPHSALNGRTPDEAWNGVELPKPISFYARDELDLNIQIRRRSYAGDPRLPIVDISVAVCGGRPRCAA